MDDLVTRLRAQLDEDERVARFAQPRHGEQWTPGYGFTFVKNVDVDRHIIRHDPARVLREVEAKRRIVDYLARELADTGGDNPYWYDDKLTDVLELLALPYADRPGYRDEWRP